MKHQPAIHSIRLVNMKSGITEAQRYIDIFMCSLQEKMKTQNIIPKDLEELEEIQSLLDWVKNQ